MEGCGEEEVDKILQKEAGGVPICTKGGYFRTNGEERCASTSCGVQHQAEILQTRETWVWGAVPCWQGLPGVQLTRAHYSREKGEKHPHGDCFKMQNIVQIV